MHNRVTFLLMVYNIEFSHFPVLLCFVSKPADQGLALWKMELDGVDDVAQQRHHLERVRLVNPRLTLHPSTLELLCSRGPQHPRLFLARSRHCDIVFN